MPTPALRRYINTPFNAATEVHLIDQATGDGTTSTWTLANKTGLQLGASVQVDGDLHPRFTGAATVDGNDVSLLSAPPLSAQIIFPGSGAIKLNASDQNDALGRVVEKAVYIADISTIQFYEYSAYPGDSGIKLQFSHLITADPSAASWFQLAPALADGTAGTYGAAGDPLYTGDISASDVLTGATSIGATSLNVVDGSQFTAGDYIMIAYGTADQEVVKITSIASNTLTVVGCTYAHSISDTVLTCGRKFWIKMTIPLNATSGLARNLYGTPLMVRARVTTRP